MESKSGSGLRHMPAGSALAAGSRRSNIVARGRRDAVTEPANAHYQQAIAAYTAGDFAAAAASFRQAATQGHAESQYLLSTMLDEGQGAPQDAGEAARWERAAAEQNHGYAQANVSYRCYMAGNLSQAFAWCRRAADGKLPWAQYNLGLMYRKGEGVARDDAEAARWYSLAAEGHLAQAQTRLAELYYLGMGVPRNYVLAALWYRRAAEQGNAEAQYQLGHLYSVGDGVEHDYVQSRSWVREAARQGHPEAVSELKNREYRDA